MSIPQTIVTGFPSLVCREFVRYGAGNEDGGRVVLFTTPAHGGAARDFVSQLQSDSSARVTVLEGQLTDLDWGLSGAEVQQLIQDTTHIIHPGGVDIGGRSMDEHPLQRLRGLLALAQDMPKLQRVCLLSTAFVSGSRSGLILEEDLDEGQRLRTPFERSMFELEQIARAMMPRVPITVLRPSAMVGNSQTGDASGLTEGPKYLLSLMVRLPADIPFFLPGTGVVPFNIVPVDYVVAAGWALSREPSAMGRTFHLTDPNPMSARQAFDLVADLMNRSNPFVGSWLGQGIKRALRASGLSRLLPRQMALLEDLTTHVTYCCAGTLECLSSTDIICPPFESYADAFIKWLANYEKSNRRFGDSTA